MPVKAIGNGEICDRLRWNTAASGRWRVLVKMRGQKSTGAPLAVTIEACMTKAEDTLHRTYTVVDLRQQSSSLAVIQGMISFLAYL